MSTFKLKAVIGFFLFTIPLVNAQNSLPNITGSLSFDAQYYLKDTAIQAEVLPQKQNPGVNAYLNLYYSKDNFKAGARYEAYLPPMLGFNPDLKGNGLVYRFAEYNLDNFQFTVGNFYEQFGSGLILRSYNEPQLGMDNSIDGFRAKYNSKNGISVTGLIGRHRNNFIKSEGIVQGVDATINLNSFLGINPEAKLKLSKSLSYVNKFESYLGSKDFIPTNVEAISDRWVLGYNNFNLEIENAFKSKDPNSLNNDLLKRGRGFFVNASYSKPGLGINLNFKQVDNFNFRSERATVTLNTLFVNYLPAISKQHTYRLLTLYPYTTQANGEIGLQGDIFYTIKKGSKLGGKYGTNVSLNFSNITNNSINLVAGPEKYTTNYFVFGGISYYRDINLEVSRKWNKNFKSNFMYAHIDYNKDVIEGRAGFGLVYINAYIADFLFKLPNRKSIRTEFQHMSTSEKKGNWAQMLVEYAIPNWFFYISDEFNYTNNLHYANTGVAYVNGSTRLGLAFGRQRAGLVCVGGVCRIVPAYTGLSLSLTSTF